ncbi:MAG: hypothetical protein RBU37_07010 [Myxococcota bacterium]|nr:hypothetical protein [Myxococcota bacterium]
MGYTRRVERREATKQCAPPEGKRSKSREKTQHVQELGGTGQAPNQQKTPSMGRSAGRRDTIGDDSSTLRHRSCTAQRTLSCHVGHHRD